MSDSCCGAPEANCELLCARALSVGHAADHILKDVSFSVQGGERLALVGSRGSGKTTLVRALVRDGVWQSGEVLGPQGVPLATLSDAQLFSLVAVVPERNRLFPSLTVDENLHLARLSRTSARSLRSEIAAFYSRYENIGRARQRPAATLSGGEGALVALKRAELTDCPVLICDEPFLGLSPAWCHEAMELLRDAARAGRAVIVTEENASRIACWATNTLFLDPSANGVIAS